MSREGRAREPCSGREPGVGSTPLPRGDAHAGRGPTARRGARRGDIRRHVSHDAPAGAPTSTQAEHSGNVSPGVPRPPLQRREAMEWALEDTRAIGEDGEPPIADVREAQAPDLDGVAAARRRHRRVLEGACPPAHDAARIPADDGHFVGLHPRA